MVSERLRPSATRPGTSGLVPRYRPPLRDCTRTRMATSSTFARWTCRFTMLSGMRSHYIKPGATGGDIVPADRPAREERTDRNQPAGNGESRIGKPAPLNAARVRHPQVQNRSKARPPVRLTSPVSRAKSSHRNVGNGGQRFRHGTIQVEFKRSNSCATEETEATIAG